MSRFGLFFLSLTLPLIAETIGNVQFQFPPSSSEWRLLTTLDNGSVLDFDNDEEREGANESEKETKAVLAVYTHREGDAFEILAIIEEETGENETMLPADEAQAHIEKTFGKYLPNHRILLTALIESENHSLIEWELNDGTHDLLHGYLRRFMTPGKKTILQYATSAQKTDLNRSIWTTTLVQANISEK